MSYTPKLPSALSRRPLLTSDTEMKNKLSQASTLTQERPNITPELTKFQFTEISNKSKLFIKTMLEVTILEQEDSVLL